MQESVGVLVRTGKIQISTKSARIFLNFILLAETGRMWILPVFDLQCGTYLFYRDSHLYIDCIYRYVQDLRYFFVFKAVFPDQFKYHFASGW